MFSHACTPKTRDATLSNAAQQRQAHIEQLQQQQDLNEQDLQHHIASIRIQSLYRARAARTRSDRRRSEIKQKHSATLIQSLIRGKRARNHVKIQEHSAILIQSLIRGKRARRKSSLWISRHRCDDDDDGTTVRTTRTKLRRYNYQNIGDPYDAYSVWVCGCVHTDNVVRKSVLRWIQTPAFERTVDVVIVLDCVIQALTYETLNDETISKTLLYNYNWVLDGVEYLALSVYTLEMIFKMLAFGLNCKYKKSYCRSGWNVLDFFVVVISYVGVFFQYIYMYEPSSFLGHLHKEFKISQLRMIRPLRMIKSHSEILKICVGIWSALPNLWAVFVLTLGIIIMWGVLGMHLYGHGALSGRVGR